MSDIVLTLVVNNLVRFKDLEEEDQAIPGTYEVELQGVTDQATPSSLAETALDAFHDRFGIECLDDFEITCYDAQGKAIERDEAEARSDATAGDVSYVSASTRPPQVSPAPTKKAAAKGRRPGP